MNIIRKIDWEMVATLAVCALVVSTVVWAFASASSKPRPTTTVYMHTDSIREDLYGKYGGYESMTITDLNRRTYEISDKLAVNLIKQGGYWECKVYLTAREVKSCKVYKFPKKPAPAEKGLTLSV